MQLDVFLKIKFLVVKYQLIILILNFLNTLSDLIVQEY